MSETDETCCWNCSVFYRSWLAKCPSCNAANANVNYLEAVAQCGFATGSFPPVAKGEE